MGNNRAISLNTAAQINDADKTLQSAYAKLDNANSQRKTIVEARFHLIDMCVARNDLQMADKLLKRAYSDYPDESPERVKTVQERFRIVDTCIESPDFKSADDLLEQAYVNGFRPNSEEWSRIINKRLALVEMCIANNQLDTAILLLNKANKVYPYGSPEEHSVIQQRKRLQNSLAFGTLAELLRSRICEMSAKRQHIPSPGN